MPSIPSSRLTKTDVLTRMSPSSINTLLVPFAGYFKHRGVPLDDLSWSRQQLERLFLVLASPTETTPPELTEKLELLDLISQSQSMLNFEDEYQEVVNACREASDTSADLAVKILLRAPEIAWREFDRQVLLSLRTYSSFRVAAGVPFSQVTAARIEELRALISPWFAANARTAACQIRHLVEPHGVSFVIRHGDMNRRFDLLNDDGRQEFRILRPERVDVVHFRAASNEWQISGMGSRIPELYRQSFGQIFHGCRRALRPSKRYSLEPLREGRSALACNPRGKVLYAELKSLKLGLPGKKRITLEQQVFETLDAMDRTQLGTANLLEATLSLRLPNRSRMKVLKICPERDTVHGDTGEPAVNEWLVQKRFAMDPHEDLLLANA